VVLGVDAVGLVDAIGREGKCKLFDVEEVDKTAGCDFREELCSPDTTAGCDVREEVRSTGTAA
jgi:hypothetical protein